MSHQFIPLNLLVVSAANVRRTDRKADLESLMASIKAHGLLQNLTVQKRDDTHFEVVAGGRRLAALKALAKAGDIARDFPTPCHVIDGDGAGEASLAENVERVAMNAMDEADAFAALAKEDFNADAIAHRFGVSTRHVEQRMALSSLSPKIKAAYRRGDINLDAARAFCIEVDHTKQDAAYKALGTPITSAAQVRSLLSQGAMKASDRIALFVGLEVYETVGGALTRDMFDDANIIVADPDLMTRLANDKLDGMRAELLTKGWAWVDVNTGHAQSGHLHRIHARQRNLTKAEKKRLAEIDARLEDIDRKLDASEVEDDTLLSARNDEEAARDALMASLAVWDKQEVALAGATIGIDYAGKAVVVCGLVKKENLTALKKLQAASSPADREVQSDDTVEGATVPVRQFSKTLTRELTTARNDALRTCLLNAPRTGLAVTAFALLQLWRGGLASGVEIHAHATDNGHKALARAQAILLADAPEDEVALLRWCLQREQEHLIAIIAASAASALSLVHEGQTQSDLHKQALADVLAKALDLDMTAHWRPDLDFWSRVSKHEILSALESATQRAKLSERRREKQRAVYAKLKRDELAKRAAKMLKVSPWLPEVLITPVGGVELTADGKALLEDAIAA